MPVQSKNNGPYIRGIVASNQPYAQAKGSIPRGSNLIFTSRGALDPCDGSQLVHAFDGILPANRGKNLANLLFAPTGVSRYYLALIKALDVRLGPPQNLTISVGGTGGTLLTGTYFYVVTALDGTGGETIVSNEVSSGVTLGQNVTLTWNIVPNATQYNVYRGTSAGAEGLLAGANVPVSQVAFGTLTASFIDTGADAALSPFPITSMQVNSVVMLGSLVQYQVVVTVPTTVGLSSGQFFAYTPGSDPNFAAVWQILSIVNGTSFLAQYPDNAGHGGTSLGLINGETTNGGTGTPQGTGGVVNPPLFDTTQQTALFQMPVIVGSPAVLPVAYDNRNIVALFPADPIPPGAKPDGGGGGGSGGGGGTGGGGASGGGSTPSGGIPGNVSLIPQILQFTNRAVLALGNGFPPQIYSDPATPTNPATTAVISSVTADAFGVVTVVTATPHGIPTAAVGGNVLISGVTNPGYDYVGPTIAIVSATSYKVRNLTVAGAGASSGGTSRTTALPIINTFVPAFPAWTASTVYSAGDILVPATQPSSAIFLTVTQGGTSGTVEPTWPTGGLASVGQSVADGSVIYQVTGLLNSAAPAPPGAAHIIVYGNALWVFDTSTTNTASGIDGPCSLRQSSIGNPNSWNPINQAFLDKDDGTEGMGMAKFTITAQGIPPEGSLVAFKNFQAYQIIGVFGAQIFAIQAVSSDMGCISPRTLQFVPGFGIGRMTHLGIAMFNGVQDNLISEQIRPYLFPINDNVYGDISVVDSSWISVSWASQTANPPMYVIAVPVGQSNGMLTRLLCYDLVLKVWGIVDLPFAISTMAQFKTVSANPVTILGGFSDGALSRWQAGDILWDTGASGTRNPSKVLWSFQNLTAASQDNDQAVYCRRLVVTLVNSGGSDFVSVTPIRNGVPQTPLQFFVPANQDFDIDAAVGLRGKRFAATISGTAHVEIDGDTWELEPRPAGVVVGV